MHTDATLQARFKHTSYTFHAHFMQHFMHTHASCNISSTLVQHFMHISCTLHATLHAHFMQLSMHTHATSQAHFKHTAWTFQATLLLMLLRFAWTLPQALPTGNVPPVTSLLPANPYTPEQALATLAITSLNHAKPCYKQFAGECQGQLLGDCTCSAIRWVFGYWVFAGRLFCGKSTRASMSQPF